MARIHRICKNTDAGARFLSGLFVILVLACAAPTGSGSTRPQQKPAESGIGQTARSEISQPEAPQPDYVKDEVLVKFKPGTDAETIEHIRSTLKLEIMRRFSSPNLFLMKITDGTSVPAVIEQLKTFEAVKYAEPNYVVTIGQ